MGGGGSFVLRPCSLRVQSAPGCGITILFEAGEVQWSGHCLPVIHRLSGNFYALADDRSALGQSSRSKRCRGILQMAEELGALLDALSLHKPAESRRGKWAWFAYCAYFALDCFLNLRRTQRSANGAGTARVGACGSVIEGPKPAISRAFSVALSQPGQIDHRNCSNLAFAQEHGL